MATLPGQRASFTYELKQYNLSEDEEDRAIHAKRMARTIERAPTYGFTVEQVTQGQLYPDEEVRKYLEQPFIEAVPEVNENQAIQAIEDAVDTGDVLRFGEGSESVYAYSYACAPDHIKIGRTKNNVVTRIVSQINESTPGKPVLQIVLQTINSVALERALHAVLELRQKRVTGGGKEWFRVSRNDVIDLYQLICRSEQT